MRCECEGVLVAVVTQREPHLSMVIGRVLGNGPSQLRDLDLPLVVALEAGEEDLPLAWLQTVHHAGNGALIVHVGEQNQLLVDELRVGDVIRLLSIEVGLEGGGREERSKG